MMTIEDLLRPDEELRRYAAKPEMDPLSEQGALQEAQLLDVRFVALKSTVALLFELRTALQLRESNTGVLIARGVRELSWTAGARTTRRTAWTVGGSFPRNERQLFDLTLGMWPQAQVRLISESAAFFSGDVPGLDRIPDYGDDDENTIDANIARWTSRFIPNHAVFLDAAPAAQPD
jgi:hypothetical protein